MSKNTSILSEHKRIGKKFIPQFIDKLGDVFEETSWIKQGIPELFWIALLNHRYGVKTGADLTLSIAKAARQSKSDGVWYGKASNFELLTKDQKDIVVNVLREQGKLSHITKVMDPFKALYPQSPLAFLSSEAVFKEKELEAFKHEMKEAIALIYDKTSHEATFVQANGIYIAYVTGILQVTRGTNLKNFPEIEKYPSTEESKKIASFVRASINVFISMMPSSTSTEWQTYFWNRGLEIDECEVNI